VGADFVRLLFLDRPVDGRVFGKSECFGGFDDTHAAIDDLATRTLMGQPDLFTNVHVAHSVVSHRPNVVRIISPLAFDTR
jgi:hypothetical protein